MIFPKKDDIFIGKKHWIFSDTEVKDYSNLKYVIDMNKLFLSPLFFDVEENSDENICLLHVSSVHNFLKQWVVQKGFDTEKTVLSFGMSLCEFEFKKTATIYFL